MLDQGPLDATAVVQLPAEIDVACQDQACRELQAAVDSGMPVVIADLSGTTFCDCSSLYHLLDLQRRAAVRGSQLQLVIPPGSQVRHLAELMNLDEQLLAGQPASSDLRMSSLASRLPRKPALDHRHRAAVLATAPSPRCSPGSPPSHNGDAPMLIYGHRGHPDALVRPHPVVAPDSGHARHLGR
jgi:anti-anti-sigma regulatory factor